MNIEMIEKDEILLEKVNKALAAVRPFLHADGGDIEVVEITDDMILKVRLLGSCETCPMSFSTIKAGVEQSVLAIAPEIKSVISVP